MRPVWSGAIAFGLVTIPVRLFPAVESKREVAFRLLDSKTLTPIKEIRVNPKTGREVPWQQITRGVEYAKGRFLPLSPEELAALPLPSANTVDLFGFVEVDTVEPVMFETAYYAAPGAGGQKAYGLLRDALTKLRKAGVGKVALRTREHLALIRPDGNVLVLQTLHFADEIRAAGAVPDVPRRSQGAPAERRMAEQLVASMAVPFEPARYRSEYKKALLDLIKAKRQGKELPAPPEQKVIDLQQALRRSLDEANRAKSRRPRRRVA